MCTRIILTVLDGEGRPYIGVFDSDESFYPKTYPNGALMEEEHDFLIGMARECKKVWLPADSHRQPIGCIPFGIIEAVWAQLEAGPGCYYKFIFKPPLEIEYDGATLQGV
jgi:hypothetical protein